jgi:6-phosphogluconolactonase/glucosamine-6-phosphate isomerase/deaminase
MLLSGAEVRLFDDKDAVADATAETILDQANAAIAKRGRFRLVLAGGTTPTAAYRLLRDRDADWAAWHIYHGDERCLAVDDPERNSLVADEAWLHHVPIPRAQVHPIPAELGAEPAADDLRCGGRGGIAVRSGATRHRRGRAYREPLSGTKHEPDTCIQFP